MKYSRQYQSPTYWCRGKPKQATHPCSPESQPPSLTLVMYVWSWRTTKWDWETLRKTHFLAQLSRVAASITTGWVNCRNSKYDIDRKKEISHCLYILISQAILKKAKALRLTPVIRAEEAAKLFMKKILALAFLPAARIPEQYGVLKDGLPAPLKRSFAAFFTYYERQWLAKVKPAGFSVYRLSRRTNNVTESYNSVLKENMGQHPSAWTFICKYS